MACDIGVYGLAVMGQNLALNIASKGFVVSVGNRSYEKVKVTLSRASLESEAGGPLFSGTKLQVTGNAEVDAFVKSLKRPRKVIILVQAGAAVDETIAKLSEFMEPGDVLIDGGNEWFPNSIKYFAR